LTPTRIAKLVEQALPSLASDLRVDYLRALDAASTRERSERGRCVLWQLQENARIAASERVPLCQDTGYVWVLLELGGDVCVPANIFSEVNAAVARAYTAAGLRKSLARDALLDRDNSGDNTPAFCELQFTDVPSVGGDWPATGDWSAADAQPATGASIGGAATGDERATINVQPATNVPRATSDKQATSDRQAATGKGHALLHIMLKGGGSDNASRLVMLPPGAGVTGVRDVVLTAVREKAAAACPPLVIGVGVGSTFDKVAGLAKRALLREIGSPNPEPRLQALEQEWLAEVNALGIGPGGFGGDTTALALQIKTAPCHIAALPVAVNIGCTALRSRTIDLL
jgi:tartrate dehydratase alpha subunit/fumarate hydratase class I-like protein